MFTFFFPSSITWHLLKETLEFYLICCFYWRQFAAIHVLLLLPFKASCNEYHSRSSVFLTFYSGTGSYFNLESVIFLKPVWALFFEILMQIWQRNKAVNVSLSLFHWISFAPRAYDWWVRAVWSFLELVRLFAVWLFVAYLWPRHVWQGLGFNFLQIWGLANS